MSRAAKKETKLQRQMAKYREADTWLGRLLEGFASGADRLPDGNACDAEAIAREIMGKYRHVVRSDSNVSFDGPLCEDIRRAIEAAKKRGRLLH